MSKAPGGRLRNLAADMGAAMLSVGRSKYTRHFLIASVAPLLLKVFLYLHRPRPPPLLIGLRGSSVGGVSAVSLFGCTWCGGPSLTGVLVVGLSWSLNSPLPLRSRIGKRIAVGTLVLGITRTVLLVLSWRSLLLVPVVFCSITDLTVAALALALGIRTCACYGSSLWLNLHMWVNG